MSPVVLRMTPPVAGHLGGAGGVRGGPRISTPLTDSGFAGGFHYAGDANSFALPQWSVAYDVVFTYAFDDAWELHLGGQGELSFPVPIPGYGLYGGVSRYFRLGAFSVTPALAVRGATDFGLRSFGGPGSVLGAELSSTFAYHPEPRFALGFAPFIQVQQVWAGPSSPLALYAGGALACQVPLGSTDGLEFTAGFGRVFIAGGPAFNAPILGLRLVK